MTTTFLARVSDRILTKADRLFSNRLSDVFIEILQNSRRAGASLVEVATSEVDGGTQIVFADNGSGIDDFSTLLHLGNSGWSSETESLEDPAGIGFFALTMSGVTVLSNGKGAVITKEAFLGKEPVEVTESSDSPVRGTVLTFVRPEKIAVVAEELGKAVKFGSTEVTLNGVRLDRRDFLADAVYVKEINGVRLGIFRGGRYWASNSLINFHGLVIGGSGSSESFSLSDVLIPQSNRNVNETGIYVSIDVLETTRLRLKLPDRSAVVQDDHFDVLKREAQIAMFEYLATLPQHQASFKLYKEAHSLGIKLQEAAPFMSRFAVMPYDCNGDRETIDGCGDGEEVVNPAECAIVDLSGEASDSDDPSFTFDVGARFFEKLPRIPLQECSKFEGYSWYDQMSHYTRFKLKVNGKPCSAVEISEVVTLVDSIQLSFVLQENKAKKKASKFVWNLPFAGYSEDTGCEDVVLFVTRNSVWTKEGATEPFDLVHAAQHIAFSYNEDAGADSFDSQLEYFQEWVNKAIIGVLRGPLAQARHALRESLGWELTSSLDRANLQEVRLFKNGKQWEFAVIEPSPEQPIAA